AALPICRRCVPRVAGRARRPGARRAGDGPGRPCRRRHRTRMKRRLPTSGGEIAFVDEGEGPAVVLLHGFPSSSYSWRTFVPMLAARHRVIAPDLLGFGESDMPEDVSLGVTAQAGYVRELLEAL